MEKRKRELPTVTIMDIVYLVDIENDCLKAKENPENTIPFSCMEYRENHYVLSWRESPDHVLWTHDQRFAKIPQKVELDPEGMKVKYNLSPKKLKGKSDFDIIVDQQLYDDRVNKCMLPEIDIAGHKYFIDLRCKEFRLTTDSFKSIPLADKFDELFTEQYFFYYHIGTKQAAEIDPDITSLPRGVVWIETPPISKLDPVAVARKIGDDIKNYLLHHPFEKELKAKVVPLSQTELAELVKSNKAALDKNKEELIIKNRKSNKSERGKHL